MLAIFVTIFAMLNSSLAQFDPSQHRNWNLMNNDICGMAIANRIIGGHAAHLGEFPWIARLLYSGSREITFICSGSILNKRYIITAGHCTSMMEGRVKVYVHPSGGPDKNIYSRAVVCSEVVLGDWDTRTLRDCEDGICSRPTQTIRASEVLRHPSYDSSRIKDDITLIRLEKDIMFNEFVRPICLAGGSLTFRDLTGIDTIAAGWGLTDYHRDQVTAKLLKVHLQVLDGDSCYYEFPYNQFDGNKQLCAGGRVGRDTCSGDSGGPLMMVAAGHGPQRVYLAGIVSYGDKHCGEGIPVVYTRVTYYAKWILDNIRQ